MNTPMRQVTHHLTGREADVVRVLDNAHARGRLVSWRLPQRHHDGRVSIVVTLLEPAPATRRASWRLTARGRRRLVLAAKGLAWTAGAAAVAGVGWGLCLLVQWIAAHLLLPVGVGVAVLVLAGIAASAATPNSTGTGRACVGVHCRGCQHR